MVELIRSNDFVLLSYIEALLTGQGIGCVIFDQHMSVLDGSIAAIARRVMVLEEDLPAAQRLIRDMGLGHELRGEP